MSCSWTQQSITRTCMNTAYGTLPIGLGPSRSRSWSLMACMAWSRSLASASNSASTSDPGVFRRASIHPSFILPIGLCTWGRSSGTAGGASRPANIDSVPMTCDSWSFTVHPGHSVGLAQSSSLSSWPSAAIEDQTSSSSPMNARSTIALVSFGAVRSDGGPLDGVPAAGLDVGREGLGDGADVLAGLRAAQFVEVGVLAPADDEIPQTH